MLLNVTLQASASFTAFVFPKIFIFGFWYKPVTWYSAWFEQASRELSSCLQEEHWSGTISTRKDAAVVLVWVLVLSLGYTTVVNFKVFKTFQLVGRSWSQFSGKSETHKTHRMETRGATLKASHVIGYQTVRISPDQSASFQEKEVRTTARLWLSGKWEGTVRKSWASGEQVWSVEMKWSRTRFDFSLKQH